MPAQVPKLVTGGACSWLGRRLTHRRSGAATPGEPKRNHQLFEKLVRRLGRSLGPDRTHGCESYRTFARDANLDRKTETPLGSAPRLSRRLVIEVGMVKCKIGLKRLESGMVFTADLITMEKAFQ